MQHLEPKEAFAFLQAHPEALLVDIRMEIEHLYVGHPPGAIHVAWYEYPDMSSQPQHFTRQVGREAGSLLRPLVLLCRSGNRTAAAGAALEAAGFTEVMEVLHGFEGDLDEHFQRSKINGWRFEGLPWQQM